MAHRTLEIPMQVLDYLGGHHIITLATTSFTGMPHAATVAYASDASGLYFSMPPDELTVHNIRDNHWASFTASSASADLSQRVRDTLNDLNRNESD
jgi:nitroimidazol reductase NimA-like FMN-containing flavoprotein (pyridoxamine 5'-phosphate oxidase superfamily)